MLPSRRINSQRRISSERGFALVVAIMACVILFALAMLVIHLSTGDLRVSARSVGDKKAFVAAETGVQQLMANFDPQNSATTGAVNNVQVNSANDPNTVYSYTAPAPPTFGAPYRQLTGYDMGGGQSWGLARYDTTVTGRNTTYGTSVQVALEVGCGPVNTSTMSR